MSNQQGMTRLTEVAPELQICCPDRRRPAAPRDWSKIDDRPSIPDQDRPGAARRTPSSPARRLAGTVGRA
jgi:hypothetical protein